MTYAACQRGSAPLKHGHLHPNPHLSALPLVPTPQDALRVSGQQLHGARGAAASATARQLAPSGAFVLICATTSQGCKCMGLQQHSSINAAWVKCMWV